MSIDEIIEGLEKLAKNYEVCANEPSLAQFSIVYLNTVSLLQAAIEKMKASPDNQPNEPNEPLTADELQEMIGQPVYYPDTEEWKIVDKFAIQAVYCDGARLYRRPPKEESNEHS